MHHLRPFTSATPLLLQVAYAKKKRTSEENASDVDQVRNRLLVTKLMHLLLSLWQCCRQNRLIGDTRWGGGLGAECFEDHRTGSLIREMGEDCNEDDIS